MRIPITFSNEEIDGVEILITAGLVVPLALDGKAIHDINEKIFAVDFEVEGELANGFDEDGERSVDVEIWSLEVDLTFVRCYKNTYQIYGVCKDGQEFCTESFHYEKYERNILL